MLDLTRRAFLQSITAMAATAGLKIPAGIARRQEESSTIIMVFRALDGEMPAKGYATFNTRRPLPEDFDFSNDKMLEYYTPVIDFDDSLDETIIFSGIVPQEFSRTILDLYFSWDVKTVGRVVWGATLQAVDDVNSGDMESTVVDIPGDDYLGLATIQLNRSIPSGHSRLLITRLASNPLDTAIGDAKLLAGCLRTSG
jgi:hypothetical protein